MEFRHIQKRALTIREQYEAWEKEQYGRSWTREEIAMGLVGDVGDLMKLVMAQAGMRYIPDKNAKLRHELADCLWSLLVLADKYEIDLEQAFLDTTDELEQWICEKRDTL